MIRSFVLISLITICPFSFAKGNGMSIGGSGSGSGGTDLKGFGLAFLGGGGGNADVMNPVPQMGLGAALFGVTGVEFFPQYVFSLTFGISGFVSPGNLDYDYISPTNIHYKLGSEEFNWTGWEVYGGLKIHLLNFSFFKLYGEGGGSVGQLTINYSSATALDTQGHDYQTSEDKISVSGLYAEAGFDIMPSKWGFRLAARYSMHTTSNIEAFGFQAVRFSNMVGYLAFLRSIE